MQVTLTRNIIVNDGKRGVFRKKGDSVDVDKNVAKILIANSQAEMPVKKNQ